MLLAKLLTGSLFLHCVLLSHACTTFFIHHNGKMVFGRNYDWMADAGMVCTNQRGLLKTSLKIDDGKTISWVAQYGSISFNQYGKEFPTGGMNEKGLVVELMWLDATLYPKPDDRPAIGVLQWIQYQLDNCATTDEVIATSKKLRIVSRGTPLHYLVADAKGNAASIEFLDGKMVVHKGDNMPMTVLTNDRYDQSIASYKIGATNGNNSLQRFSTACKMIEEYKSNPGGRTWVEHSFDILQKVSQGDYTKWSIVYDITDKKIYFKTNQYQQLKSVSFSSFDFSCTKNSLVLDINQDWMGDMIHYFEAYSAAFNNLIFEKSIKQSGPQIVLKEEEKRAVKAYPDTINCK